MLRKGLRIYFHRWVCGWLDQLRSNLSQSSIEVVVEVEFEVWDWQYCTILWFSRPGSWSHWSQPRASPAVQDTIPCHCSCVDLPATAIHQVTIYCEPPGQPWPCVPGVGPPHLPPHRGRVPSICHQTLALCRGGLRAAVVLSSLTLWRASWLYWGSSTVEPS